VWCVLEFLSHDEHFSNTLVVHAAVRHLHAILSLVLTNSEVRKLLSDFSLIGLDFLARAASKAAERLHPDLEALARVDDSPPRTNSSLRADLRPDRAKHPCLMRKCPGPDMPRLTPKEDMGAGAAVQIEIGEVKSGQQVYEE
jgi:hypothetical protein